MSIDKKDVWPVSASDTGLDTQECLRSEGEEANFEVLVFVGVVAAVVVVRDVVSATLVLVDCCLPVIFLNEFFSSTLRSLCTLERCFLMVSRVRVMMPQMIHLYAMFW